jgi:hypothetical protein
MSPQFNDSMFKTKQVNASHNIEQKMSTDKDSSEREEIES